MREDVSLAAFIRASAGKKKDDVRMEAEREKAEAERFAVRTPLFRRGVPSGPPQEAWRAYGEALRSFLFFIYNGRRPGMVPEGYAEFRPLVEGWVRSGELPGAALAAFDGTA
jgi:hypothetical protein